MLDNDASHQARKNSQHFICFERAESDECEAQRETEAVPASKKKIDKKWGLITSTHRHRRSFRRMANICILIDSVSSLLLLSLHVFQDH